MTKRLPTTTAPLPLEAYAAQFDDLFARRSQREGFRRYLEGLLLPAERNKTATALANTEPTVGAQHPRAQALQWFLSESTWDAAEVNARRTALLRADPATAPDEWGVLVIDEHGDRKWGRKTAHGGRQYLANLGKTDSGVVSVTSLWADEQVYWPLDYEPYTPQHHFAKGKADPAFRTKLAIAGELVTAAVADGLPFRAVVADSFYGEDAGFRRTLHGLQVGYVLALKPSHTWWHQIGTVGALWEAAELAGWRGADAPGAWVAIERRFRDGHAEAWWALEVGAGPYGPARGLRAVVATTDPATLPDHTTWYLATNLPPGDADLAEVVRLYGLRMWVEQSYKQTKYALGWSHYQVRSDAAMRRHWQLVCCAFAFCWQQQSDDAVGAAPARGDDEAQPVADEAAGRGEMRPMRPPGCWPVALRAVRAWLEPWVLLRRYWRAWSALPPPPALRALLEYLRHGYGLDLYASP
jgi:SRSO17 transposase